MQHKNRRQTSGYVISVTDMKVKLLIFCKPHIIMQQGVKMKCNSGTIDRTLRIIIGVVLLTLVATGTVGVWGWIGIVPLITGAVGFCPAYTILGLNTCTIKKT